MNEGIAPREIDAMRRAISAALSVELASGPNPRVGCVLLAPSGELLATGVHRGAGTRHAETDALAQAGERAQGATAVVSLEPCNHTGRTGPCAEALIEAGIAKVIYAQADPSPRASGGAQALRAAGLDVVGGLLADVAASINPYWTFSVNQDRPFVTLKYAASLDGRIAAVDGSSQWLTGESARADVHRLRASCDAILCGTGTLLADNPQLTARVPGTSSGSQALRVVMGRRTPPADAAAQPLLHLPTHDPHVVLQELAEREVRRVLIEGGSRIAAAFLGEGLVDEVVGYLAPLFLGDGVPASAAHGVLTLDQAQRWHTVSAKRFGDDVRIRLLHRKVVGRPGFEMEAAR